MTVWTISWQAGSGGERVAHLLAERAGVPLVHPETVAAVRGAFESNARMGRLTSWLSDIAASGAPVFVAPTDLLAARTELPSARELIESVILEAARSPAVVVDCSAFAILAGHPGACHVRIRAPLEWRVRLYASENCLSRQESKQAVDRLERQRNAFVQRQYGAVLDSVDNFTIVCNASRFPPNDLVGVLLAAGRRADQRV
jgi:cytidylate kinase